MLAQAIGELNDRHNASQALYSLWKRHRRRNRLRWALRIQVKFISEATVANISCFLGIPDANYAHAITAKNKRVRDVLTQWIHLAIVLRALLIFFQSRKYPAYFHDCTYNQTKILRAVLNIDPILHLLLKKIESCPIIFIQNVLHQ